MSEKPKWIELPYQLIFKEIIQQELQREPANVVRMDQRRVSMTTGNITSITGAPKGLAKYDAVIRADRGFGGWENFHAFFGNAMAAYQQDKTLTPFEVIDRTWTLVSAYLDRLAADLQVNVAA